MYTLMTKIMLYFFFFTLTGLKIFVTSPLTVYIYCLSCLLPSGDLKDGKNKTDRKDQANVGSDSKKTDGKTILPIIFFHKICTLMQGC